MIQVENVFSWNLNKYTILCTKLCDTMRLLQFAWVHIKTCSLGCIEQTCLTDKNNQFVMFSQDNHTIVPLYHILARTVSLIKSTTYATWDRIPIRDLTGIVSMYQDLDQKHFLSLIHSNFCFCNLVVHFNECVLVNK